MEISLSKHINPLRILVMLICQEKQYLKKLRDGDMQSFAWIFDRHYQNTFNFCLSFTKSAADAEEITADVFVTIWKKKENIDPERPIRPLLFKITKDLTWNHLKKISNSQEKKTRFLLDYAEQKVVSAEDEVIYKEYEHNLRTILQKLTPQQQKIFTLKYFKGRDLNQIAEELAISKNTVKSHLAKSKHFVIRNIPSLGIWLIFLLACCELI
jgi:RNA polymerase sigma-70 factor (ECF subfamily)